MHRAKGDFWRLGGMAPFPPKSAHGQKLESLCYIFAVDGSIFIQIFVVGSEGRMVCAKGVRNGHSWSFSFGTNRKGV